MQDIYKIAAQGGISDVELKEALEKSLEGRTLKKVLIVPPDFTRFHSQAGKITSIYDAILQDMGVQVDILPAAGLIGVITCLLSSIGVKVGAMFGDKYRAPAERIGGIVLILIGVKTLLTGLGIL